MIKFGMQTSPPRARLTKGDNSSNSTPEFKCEKVNAYGRNYPARRKHPSKKEITSLSSSILQKKRVSPKASPSKRRLTFRLKPP